MEHVPISCSKDAGDFYNSVHQSLLVTMCIVCSMNLAYQRHSLRSLLLLAIAFTSLFSVDTTTAALYIVVIGIVLIPGCGRIHSATIADAHTNGYPFVVVVVPRKVITTILPPWSTQCYHHTPTKKCRASAQTFAYGT